jgi:hypothetical protein
MEPVVSWAYYLIFRRLTALHYGTLSAHVNKADGSREIEGDRGALIAEGTEIEITFEAV